jgi:hypothetical protein
MKSITLVPGVLYQKGPLVLSMLKMIMTPSFRLSTKRHVSPDTSAPPCNGRLEVLTAMLPVMFP